MPDMKLPSCWPALFLIAFPLPAQQNFLARAFAASAGDQPLLSRDAPSFDLTVASRGLSVQHTPRPDTALLSIGDIPLRLEMRHERVAGIDLYRIRHAPAPNCAPNKSASPGPSPKPTTNR